MTEAEFLHGFTRDGLRLQAVHWNGHSDTCVVFVHGMSGNIIENYFGEVLGAELSKNGIGFIYGHNRGFSHINDIATRERSADGGNRTRRFGAAFERFEDCVFDVELWLEQARTLGYKRLILMGHSLGCNKVIHTLSNSTIMLEGVILASPPDMVGLAKLEGPPYADMLAEAEVNVASGRPAQLLSRMLWDWYYLSSQTFLDLFVDNVPADYLPLSRNPQHFKQLSEIGVPMLVLYAEHDDVVVDSLGRQLEVIKAKAQGCPKCDTAILEGTNNNYNNKEAELSKLVIDWIRSLKS